jgi:GNAT superfamily N-acetyltransferase
MTISSPYHIIGLEAAELDVPLEDFVDKLAGWKIYPVGVKGDIAGVIYHLGAEVHACILPKYRKRWFSRKIVRELLEPIIAEHGELLTAVPHNKPWGHEFVKKFGFKEVTRTGHMTKYRLETLKWA